MSETQQPSAGARTESAAEPAAVQQIRTAGEALMAEGRPRDAFDYCLEALRAVLRHNLELQLLLAKLRRERLQKSAEQMPAEQLQLLLLLEQMQQLESGLERDPLAEAQADAALDAELEQREKDARAQRAARGGRERKWQTRNVKQQVHAVELAAEQRICEFCGREQRPIGQDTTHMLEFIPAHFVEHVYHLGKYACGSCKRGVRTAPAPAKVIERSAADATLLAHVVVSKYVDHMPLQRLHRSYERSGATIAVSTLADWVAGVADRVQPLVELVAARILRSDVVRTDATGLMVLDPNSPDNIERGTIWCYVGDDRDVVFRYTPTGEGASGPWDFLAGRSGYIQADAANVFDRLYNGRAGTATEVGCWAHARRRYVLLQDTDCRVAYPLQLIARLYKLEHLADLNHLEGAARAAFRKERSEEVLHKLKRWLLTTLQNEPPSSELAKAAGYGLHQWTALTRFLEDGRLDLDNNLCEQQLRDIALGRKNFLFAGSHDAARRTATLYSLMRTCAQHNVAPLPYLTDVLRKLATGWAHNRLSELLPDHWQRLQADAASSSSHPVPATTV